jgi:hypothetical protein
LILPVALVLATLLLAALTGILPLLVGVVSAALLLTRLVLVTLVLLSALIRIISHCVVSFRKLPGIVTTIQLPTSSPLNH